MPDEDKLAGAAAAQDIGLMNVNATGGNSREHVALPAKTIENSQ